VTVANLQGHVMGVNHHRLANYNEHTLYIKCFVVLVTSAEHIEDI